MQYQDLTQSERDKILKIYEEEVNFTGWYSKILKRREYQEIEAITEELQRSLREKEETDIKETTKKEVGVYLLVKLEKYFNKLDPKSVDEFIKRAQGSNPLVFDDLFKSIRIDHGY